MCQEDRINELLKIIKKNKKISIKKLAAITFLSRSTLRRDLIKLEKDEKVTRKFGYVEIVPEANIEFGYTYRLSNNRKIKKHLAKVAHRYISNCQSLFIDSSSTCINLLPYLIQYDHLVIITNSVHLGFLLTDHPNLEVFICGGRLKRLSASVIGESAIQYLNNFTANLNFISCTGVDKNGIYMASEEQAILKRIMIKNADKTILLCDSSKINRMDYYKMCDISSINYLITDKLLPLSLKKIMEEKGIQVIDDYDKE